ncbi:MAG: hypothetical protein A3G52_00415 [Candidatus Taylorbacteria bacterium RIFCSPLOWO2_12_FULL_43_20]|uniref:Penicillin-binding protein transpeptidase domain-containing protein n=1 Tax=Candidatus Taylorbacteria bacterium RIFCSPLOWO2_12_FULL_43_20 TaxID=1802332 RepID=A0A1G2P3R7_9BACT|nr:MAG: hypothetical protein A2825_01815 [Candidatus Taylorbacteria bacterium RIFCSPHIGHO2_01_FULL_43_120]OHA22614.1 MAG: hypothetical protein A3B98_02515 [Candidatus Taylorbacteria bacterium RIFCSPHIGHO2_02_FULL_43_55]OHA31832.1 MAG: hypothetical protein A3B09_03600 [Candidatus Taylorbacteria bacterium RIFCSPLOWO2_01_FULL_43_83]OHA37755.1 MAG: hypothetical protein A3H58_01215 [Candidatus Taylorbacteria bacterium RIFCSPLOWO2_02_FULL_43_22b]OHA42201.1 MAG: hypothetical protein A3G52_00415 [Candi
MGTSLVRIRILSIGIVLFALVLSSKLYMVQVVRGEMYSESAERQYYNPERNLSDRGNIYFTDKEGKLVSAATQRVGFTLAINPSLLENAEDAYQKINSILPIGYDNFIARASIENDPYEIIAKKVEEEKGLDIADFGIDGVYLHKDKWRIYPGDRLAAHVLGIVGYKGDELAGRYGLESHYENILRRRNENLYVNFFAEIFSNVNKAIVKHDDLEGNIVTSIEPNVEITLERQLEKISEKWHSEITGGIIMNPQTGEIYAMAVYPTFDPNAFQNEKTSDIFSNPIVENVYEMGSIIKPLTMAAGLDSGAVTADTFYEDTGFGILNNTRFSNYDGVGRGWVSMQEVLNQSLNTGVAFVVKKMGKEKFAEYMFNYGLGERTGIDLPNESSGLVENLHSPRDIEYANASFGQGIAMTPIATARALSALANGGILPRPRVVSEIDYKIGFSKKLSAENSNRVLKKETAEEITRMLVEVVDTSLLEGTVKLDNYSVAAKTGTAQIPDKITKGYYDNRFLHSFFGYFPAYDPKFMVFLYTVNPIGARYSSETLTHPFFDITDFLINYYEIPPDRQEYNQ